MKKLKKFLAPVLVILAGVLYYLFGYQGGAEPEQPTAPGSPSVAPAGLDGLLEIPALTDGGRIVQHDAYIASYNTETLIPNWVAYELTAEETGGERAVRRPCARTTAGPAGPRAT